MSSQMTLTGKTLEQHEEEQQKEEERKAEAESKRWTIEFYNSECSRLKIIRDVLIKGEGIINIDGGVCGEHIKVENGEPIFTKEYEWERAKFLGEWWYSNHIKGWNNKYPTNPNEDGNCIGNTNYDDVPNHDMEANTFRDCFICVDRDGIKWDKNYCLERLNKAIECYGEKLK